MHKWTFILKIRAVSCAHEMLLWAETFKQWHIQMDIVMFQIQLKILFWKSEWFPFHVCSIYKQELWNNDTSDWERISRWILFMFQIQRICSRHLLKSSSSSTLFIHSQIRNLKSHFVWVWSHDVALNSLPCSAVIPVKQQRLKLVRGGLLKMGASDSRSDGRFFLWCELQVPVLMSRRHHRVTPARFSSAFDVWSFPLCLHRGGFVNRNQWKGLTAAQMVCFLFQSLVFDVK